MKVDQPYSYKPCTGILLSKDVPSPISISNAKIDDSVTISNIKGSILFFIAIISFNKYLVLYLLLFIMCINKLINYSKFTYLLFLKLIVEVYLSILFYKE